MTSWEQKGRAEGRREGRQQGQLTTIKRQLRIQIGKLTPALEKKLDGLSESELSDLAEALLGFSDVVELERWLARRRS